MFSRLALMAFVLMVALSCGLRTGEKKPDSSTLEFSGNEYSCVGQIAEKVDLYINDKLSEVEINSFVHCLQASFIRFAQLTHGSESGTYHPKELSQFIEKYFLKNKKISNELLYEFMVIKHVYLGGSLERVSKKDLNVAVDVLEDIRAEAVRMKPHIKVLNLRLLREQSPENLGVRLRAAQDALQQSITVIGNRLENSKQAYHFTNMERFIKEFRGFIEWDKQFPESKPVENWIEFIKVFKSVNVSANETGVSSQEWAPLIKSFSRWYILALQFEVGVKNRRIVSGVGFENTKFLMDQAFALLQDAVRAQSNLLISYGQIERVLMALRSLELLPPAIRVQSVMRMTRALLTRVFGDLSVPPEKRQSSGLTMVNLSNMSTEVYRWIYIQMNINRDYKELQSATDDDPNNNTPLLAPPVIPQEMMPGPGPIRIRDNKEQYSTEWVEFLQVHKVLRPLYKNGISKAFIANESLLNQFGIRHSHHGLSIRNFERSLVNLLFKGYSNTPNPTWTSHITENQVEAFYEDMRDLGIDLKLVDKRSTGAGRRSFLEGSVFTYAADGIAFEEGKDGEPFITLTEMVEYLGFLYSGCKLAGEIYERLAVVCEHGPPDQYGDFKLNRRCVELSVPDILLQSLDNMPELKLYISKLTTKQKLHYGKVFVDTALDPETSDKVWVEYGELTAAAMVLHYQETAMTRYDTNHDWHLDNSEVDVAAKTFSGLIDKVAGKLGIGSLSDSDKVGVLKYILAFRELPTDTLSQIELWLRNSTWVGFPIHVNRTAIAEVFETIVQKLVAPTPPKVKKVCGRGGCVPVKP